ncbi:MAG TPA: hypothetical protein VM915_01665, partial [Verrucomicrobiae bacterium]|nr:hypothetical protein [Verrucomicrobiae bacterium]
MDRFVAMAWDGASSARRACVETWTQTLLAQSPRWSMVLDAEGLRVFSFHHRGDGPVMSSLPDASGVIIGVVFERGREQHGRVRRLNEAQRAALVASDGASLISGFWGSYLSI